MGGKLFMTTANRKAGGCRLTRQVELIMSPNNDYTNRGLLCGLLIHNEHFPSQHLSQPNFSLAKMWT